MHIRLLYISGKNPDWINQACGDYCQRVRTPWHLTQQPIPLSKKHGRNDAQAIAEEGDRLLQASHQHVRIALNCSGRQLDSLEFSHWLDGLGRDTSKICFLLGGPSGFGDQVLTKSQHCLSLSLMTWPHALARLLVCEQVYRASTIVHGGSYHK